MEAIVKLALKSPLELRVVEIAGMHFENVGVNRNRRVSELDKDFYRLPFCLRGEVQQRMLVETQLVPHALEAKA